MHWRHLAKIADGDARKALNALEIAALTTAPQKNGVVHIDLAAAEQSIQKRPLFMMTKTRTTTRFPPSSNPCAAATRTPRFTGWQR